MTARELTLEANAAELQALAAEVAWNRAIHESRELHRASAPHSAACNAAMHKAFATRATASEAWRRAADARREARVRARGEVQP